MAARPCVVCVPARNEAERLPRLIGSLREQAGFRADEPLRVVVLANNCTDGTAEAARRTAGPAIALRVIEADLAGSDAHVGTARRMALDAGADWLEADVGSSGDGVLLTTDADARPPAGWVAANLRALGRADVVGGRLVIDAEAIDPEGGEPDPRLAGLHARIELYWAGVRALEDLIDPPPHDPPPRHGDHTGASLAFPVRLYRAVGGLPPLPCGEDNALVGLMREAGARVRHCPDVRVLVSDRRGGRVAGGMATEMVRRARVLDGEPYRLPEADHWWNLLRRRADLRRAFRLDADARAEACARVGLGAADLAAALAACPDEVAFVARAERLLATRDPAPRETDLDAALDDLDALIRAPRPA